MDNQLQSLDFEVPSNVPAFEKKQALNALEDGHVIFCPSYCFSPFDYESTSLLKDNILDAKHKNVSYDFLTKRLGGIKAIDEAFMNLLKTFMHRYALFAKDLIDNLFFHYQDSLIWGRTSFRPTEIQGRTSSKRKDDTRLHVDAFPASPVNGKRILRVFSNINPFGEPRVWHLGEPFQQVLEQFAEEIPRYNLQFAKFLNMIKATKTLRSAYDHYQLHLHDKMKLNEGYQQSVNKQRVEFPANSTWIVFTDQVSHAALSGQFLLEQTFYLPVNAMVTPNKAPLHYWQKEKKAVMMFQ